MSEFPRTPVPGISGNRGIGSPSPETLPMNVKCARSLKALAWEASRGMRGMYRILGTVAPKVDFSRGAAGYLAYAPKALSKG